MGFLSKTIYYNTKSGNTWSTTNTDWSDKAKIQNITKGIGTRKDSFSLEIPNIDNGFFDSTSIEEDSLVRIWMKRDGFADTDAVTDLLIEGTIRDVGESIDYNKRRITIKGFDWLEILFDNQLPIGIEGQNKTCMEVIRAILDKIKDLSPKVLIGSSIRNRELTWDPNNPSAKWDTSAETYTGDSFPKITYTTNYKPVYLIIEELLSDKYTGDGRYFFWAEAQSNGQTYLKIRKKTDVINSTVIDESDTSLEINSIKVSRAKDDVRNYIVYNCGDDLEGRPIENVYYDPVSVGKYGFKYKYMIDETKDVAIDIWTEEYKVNSVSYSTNASYSVDPYPSSYNYTWTTVQSKNAQYTDTGSYTTVTSDATYNDELVSQAEAKGYYLAEKYAEGTLYPKYEIEISLRWTNAYVLGDKYQLNIPSRNIINRPFRLVSINYSENKTMLKFEDDEQDRSA